MHASSLTRPLATLAAVAFLVVALAACGDDSNDASDTTTTKAPAAETDGGDAASTVVAKDIAFTNPTLTVKAGEDVYFQNDDGTDHTMTADDGSSFDTGHVAGGATEEFTAPAAGSYAFHCDIHKSMTGTLTVQ